MTNLTLDVNIIDFPSIPVAMLPHRCSPELLNYSVAKFIMWRKETGLSPVNQSQTFGVAWTTLHHAPEAFRFDICAALANRFPIIVMV
ncbi:putative regulatory protein [Escherichia coli]|uniref:Putative regulatory protein n=1 Tax=Escherichia coli TaxID=562 RepID=A0A377D9T5_ECOLX|nr:putative regulatory protein [Escherichia coli]